MFRKKGLMLSALIVIGLVVAILSGQTVMATSWYTDLDLESIPKYDFGGERVVIVKSRGYGAPEEGTDGYAHMQAVADYFNADIEMVYLGNNVEDEIMQRMMAGEQTDIIRGPARSWLNLYTSDVFLPLNDVLEGDSFYDKLNLADSIRYELDLAHSYTEYRGNIYGTRSFDRNTVPYGSGVCWYWNQSLFEREGLPSLYDLADEGEWTWDKMLELARKITRDTTGDGETDQFGVDWRLQTRNAFPMLTANNAALTREIDGKVVFTLDEPQALEVFDFTRKFFEEGLVFTKENGNHRQGFQDGKIGMYMGTNIAYVSGLDWGWFSQENMEDDWGIYPVPVKNAGDSHPAEAVQLGQYIGIPVTAGYDAEELLTLYYAIYPRDPELPEELEEFYSMHVRDKQTLEAIKKYHLNVRGDIELAGKSARHWVAGMGVSFPNLFSGEVDPAPYLAEVKPETQAKFDDMFN